MNGSLLISIIASLIDHVLQRFLLFCAREQLAFDASLLAGEDGVRAAEVGLEGCREMTHKRVHQLAK